MRSSPGLSAAWPFGAHRRRGSRWANFAVVLTAVWLAFSRPAHAQSMSVPTEAQAELMAKLAGFDRNFAARAGSKALILLVAVADNPASTRAALELKAALSRLPKVGDLPHEEQIVTYSTATVLADLVRARKAAIVYFGPGFEKQIPALRDAFSSLNVLTVGGVPDYVASGIVLGFDLVSGRPKLLIHLVQARRQQVSFPASVLNLMKVSS
jgi:YfiR/HmsC-like